MDGPTAGGCTARQCAVCSASKRSRTEEINHELTGNHRTMNDGFQAVLDHIRSIADSEAHKGRLFERLMKAYFQKDPVYRDRFRDVWLWSEWAVR